MERDIVEEFSQLLSGLTVDEMRRLESSIVRRIAQTLDVAHKAAWESVESMAPESCITEHQDWLSRLVSACFGAGLVEALVATLDTGGPWIHQEIRQLLADLPEFLID